ncbi:DNA-binding protein [Arsukibacterium ikkense]|uniref:DNA-binding protein n=1 Tax=Arsukibacterium ikkense TaxID=336831 RepID=A0A0M2V2M5_9GAMM|nr:YheV family putative zinc ribbon protein [Arsukibacterium ikkense]KKO44624.1 DNA-binding protein [Arsukibacterium ikkense]
MTVRKKKRFIAGASCPKCHALDTMMLFLENNVEKVECVSCGHQMVQPEQQVSKASRSSEQVIGVFKPD